VEKWLSRVFCKGVKCLDLDAVGAINYEVTPLNKDAEITFQPYLDSGITNEDTNWDDKFWDTTGVSHSNNQAFIEAKTMKTDFHTCTFMACKVYVSAYCIPFYMATKNQNVARALLEYRYNHLEKAIENAEKLGFNNGAALYPMVTMNGEECHNEWEITFEEIHRNGF